MGLSLLIHRPETGPHAAVDAEAAEGMRAGVRDAVWEVADAHWSLGGDALLVSSDLSPDYLLDHFRRSLARRGYPEAGMLLVTSIGPRTAWSGLATEAEAWLRDGLA